jgi:D-3-phosphoglycerate dehydrogenase
LVAVRDATQAGIAVVNTPETNARSGAEHAVALMLTLATMLPAADRATRAGNFGFEYSSWRMKAKLLANT